MNKYGLIILRKGRGGTKIAIVVLIVAIFLFSVSVNNAQLVFAQESGSVDFFNFSLDSINYVKDLNISNLDTSAYNDLDLTKFFSPAGVSSGDLTGILKGVAVLSIQIFIVVVQVVSGIVKGILEALNP